jgi:hypothetical protein
VPRKPADALPAVTGPGPVRKTRTVKCTMMGGLLHHARFDWNEDRYARVSTNDQDLTAQRNALLALAVEERQAFVEHGLTGANRVRPGPARSDGSPRAGDTVPDFLPRATSVRGLGATLRANPPRELRPPGSPRRPPPKTRSFPRGLSRTRRACIVAQLPDGCRISVLVVDSSNRPASKDFRDLSGQAPIPRFAARPGAP